MKVVFGAVLAVVVPFAAQAEGPSYHVTGFAQVERWDLYDNEAENFGVAAVDGQVRFATQGGLTFGLDLGVDRIWDSANGAYYQGSELYPAAVVETKFGRLSLGNPREVLGQVFDMPAVAGSEMLDVALISEMQLDLFRYYTLVEPALHGYGLRYDGDFGRLSFSAALRRYDYRGFGQVFSKQEIAATYTADKWSISLGHGEAQEDHYGRLYKESAALVQAHHGKLSGGVAAYWSDYYSSARRPAIRAFAELDLTDRIRLGTTYLDTENLDIASLNATYTLPVGAFVGVGSMWILDRDPIEQYTILSAGYRF